MGIYIYILTIMGLDILMMGHGNLDGDINLKNMKIFPRGNHIYVFCFCVFFLGGRGGIYMDCYSCQIGINLFGVWFRGCKKQYLYIQYRFLQQDENGI
jgi:hypothetical protein